MITVSHSSWSQPRWQSALVVTLAFWLSSVVVLDWIVMPSLYMAGMMTEPGFAIAGYSLFWLFNRVELLCAALVLTSVLVLRQRQVVVGQAAQRSVFLGILLLGIALVDTYGLSPQMGALGIRLDWFDAISEVPALMNQMHLGYWLLDGLKLVCGTLLLRYTLRTAAQ